MAAGGAETPGRKEKDPQYHPQKVQSKHAVETDQQTVNSFRLFLTLKGVPELV